MTTKKPKRNQNKKEGLSIGRDVNISNGDFVFGDKNVNDRSVNITGDVSDSNIVTGDENDLSKTIAVREELFDNLFKKIDARPDTPPADKGDLKANVEEIKVEVEKGDEADESFLARRIRNIKRIAPDILDVVIATIANPAAGFTTVVKKIVDRAKENAG